MNAALRLLMLLNDDVRLYHTVVVLILYFTNDMTHSLNTVNHRLNDNDAVISYRKPN